MTWSYFTAYLDGSRPITKAERDELYDNLATVLTTSGCSGAGYSLNATDQAAIKASNLLTDRASLDGPGATNTQGHLHTILETASSAFTNYASAVSAALSAEGLTSTTRGEILTARVESYKLWNYYRRVIDALACCALPVVSMGSECAVIGQAFSYAISATNSPTSYNATGLPPGLGINTSTGVISGTPTTAGTYSVTISATNSCGSDDAGLEIAVGTCLLSAFGNDDTWDGTGPHSLFDDTQDVTGQFECETEVEFSWGLNTGNTARFILKANGVTLFDSGCVSSSDPYSHLVSVPAGTTSLRVLVTVGCDASEQVFAVSYLVACP